MRFTAVIWPQRLFFVGLLALFVSEVALAQSSNWMGGEALHSNRAEAQIFLDPQSQEIARALLQNVDTSQVRPTLAQPGQRIHSQLSPEENLMIQNIQVTPKTGNQFQVPTHKFNWSQQQQLLENPDASLMSGTTWGGSGGGAGLICTPAKPEVRDLTFSETLRKSAFDIQMQSTPKSQRRSFEFEKGYSALRDFQFQPGDPLIAGTLEKFESRSKINYYKDIETYFSEKSEDQIYQEISAWVKNSAPAFYLRWQMLKPKIHWTPVRSISLVPDSTFNGRMISTSTNPLSNRAVHDHYIRINLINGVYDCKKYQVLLNRFQPVARGEIPEVTVYYNEVFFNQNYSNWDKAIARIHEEWYVMATLQGHVSSEKVRETIYTVLTSMLDDIKDEQPFFFEDVTQGALKELVFPIKRLFSHQILSASSKLTETHPYHYTRLGVEYSLRSENSIRSILNQVSDAYNPEFQWDFTLSKEENYQQMDFHFTEVQLIRVEAKRLAFNTPQFLATIQSDAHALIMLIEPYEGHFGDRWSPRFENEFLLNSPLHQSSWGIGQFIGFQQFCDRLKNENNNMRENYTALNDSTYNILRSRTLNWCEQTLPQLPIK